MWFRSRAASARYIAIVQLSTIMKTSKIVSWITSARFVSSSEWFGVMKKYVADTEASAIARSAGPNPPYVALMTIAPIRMR